jgi:hypothetical protein
MRGKRSRATSASPTYEHIVWEEKKTGRGTKITGKAIVPPHTPKAKKLPIPLSKRRKLQSPVVGKGCSLEESLTGVDLIPIQLPETKKRSGKVCFAA